MNKLAKLGLLASTSYVVWSYGTLAQQIPSFPNATTPFTGAEQTYLVQGGASKNMTLNQLATWAGPTTANITTLRASCTSVTSCPSGDPIYASGVVRLTDGVANAPPLAFMPGSGICAVDNGASCVNSANSGHWVGQFINSSADAREFGAAFTGSGDQTIALQAAFSWVASSSSSLLLPCGTALFSSTIAVPDASYYSIVSPGQCSVLEYNGVSTTSDLIQFGTISTTDGKNNAGITLDGWRITSTTQMTSGAAIHLRHVIWSKVDPIIDAQYGNGKFYNGIWFDECDYDSVPFVQMAGASNAIVLVNGSLPSESWFPAYTNEIRFGAGKISAANPQVGSGTAPAYGVLIGGGVGGLSFTDTAILGNTIGLQIDNSITGTSNQSVTLGRTANVDASVSHNIVLNDTASPTVWAGGTKVFVDAGWIASAGTFEGGSTANCVNVVHWASGEVNLSGTTIAGCSNYGVYDQDATALVRIGASENLYNNTTGDVASAVTSPKIAIAAGAQLAGSAPLDANTIGSTEPIYAGPFAWTPTISFAGASSGITYSRQNGEYQMDGMLITADYAVVMTAVGSSSGAARLNGLPIGIGVPGYGGGGSPRYVTGFTGLTGTLVLNLESSGVSDAIIYQTSSTGLSNLTNSAFTNSSSLYGELSWFRP